MDFNMKDYLIVIKSGKVAEIKEFPSLEEADSAVTQALSSDGVQGAFTVTSTSRSNIGWKVGDKYETGDEDEHPLSVRQD